MKQNKRLRLSLALVALLTLTCGLATAQVFPEYTQFLGPTATPTPVPTAAPQQSGGSIFAENPYDTGADALNEEDVVDPNQGADVYQAVETIYPYAGSTPIPLDPIDMPSPTPRPELSFTYVAYTAGSLGLTFESPAGWEVDDSMTDVYTITEPVSQMHDGIQCVISVSAEPVNANYSERELKNQVTQRLKEISAVNFSSWDPSLTATRYMMGSKGVYANYTGVRADGVEVAGRILYVSAKNMLYGVEMMYPRNYRDDYLNIFAKIRETIAAQ